MKRIILIPILFSVLIVSAVRADEPDELFREGNRFYESGDYSEARSKYRTIVDYAIDNPRVYYNLANANLKLGEHGEAILYYEKARRLAPDDSDIQTNLEFARQFVVDEAPPVSAGEKFILYLLNLSPLRTDIIIFITLYWLLFLIPPLYFTFRHRGIGRLCIYGGIALFVVLILAGAVIAFENHYIKNVKHGIIITERADARSGPGENNPTLFQLHEGLKVRIFEKRKGWYLVSVSEKMNGWLPEKSLGVI